jgi:uncharacterized phage-associated protein
MGTISFQFDPEKFFQVAAYFMTRCPGDMTRKRLLKLLYFADRQHLLRYGRPIVKDYYVNMDQGPVASRAYDLIKGNHHTWSLDVLAEFDKHFDTSGMYITLRDRFLQTDLLSQSDVEILNATIAKYGQKTADHLSAISHRHKAWLESKRNKAIDYRLFFAEDESARPIRELVEESQPVRSINTGVRQLSEPQ